MNRQAAIEIVTSFKGLRGYVPEPEALKPLVDAFCSACEDEAHGREVAEAWRRESEFAPTPANVWTLAGTRERKPRGCPRCDWTGFELAKVLVNGREVDVVDRCECMEGR